MSAFSSARIHQQIVRAVQARQAAVAARAPSYDAPAPVKPLRYGSGGILGLMAAIAEQRRIDALSPAAASVIKRRRYAKKFGGLGDVDGVGEMDPIPMAAMQYMPGMIAARNALLAGVEPIPMGYDGLGGFFSKVKKTVQRAVKPVQKVIAKVVPKPIANIAKNPIAQLASATLLPVAMLPALVDKNFRTTTAPVYVAYGTIGAAALTAGAAGGGPAAIVGGSLAPAVTGAADTTAAVIAASTPMPATPPPTDYQPADALYPSPGTVGPEGFDASPQDMAQPAAEPTASPLKPLLGVGAVLAALSFLK